MPPKKGKGKGKGKQEEEDAIRLSYEPEVIKRFQTLYEIYDEDDTESIKEEDFNFFVRSLGLCPTNAKLKELAAQCREDESQTFFTRQKLEEVLKPLVIESIVNPEFELSPPTEEQLILALKSLDLEHHGHLKEGDFRTILSSNGEKFDPDELDKAAEKALISNTGVVDLEAYAGKLLYSDKLF